MENLRLSLFRWILGAKRSLWPTPMFLETKSPKKYESPQRRRLLPADNETPLPGGGTSKWTSKFNLRGLWIVVFHFLVLPNMACPRTLSQIYLGIWFWSIHEVMNIV